MKRIKNNIEWRIKYWLNDCDTHTISVVIAGFFTLMIICGISLILLVACVQIRKSNDMAGIDKAA